MEKARALYLTSPIPTAISCSATIDWDSFFTQMKVERTDAIKARIARLNAFHISVVTHDADHTEVKVDDSDASLSTVTDGLRQQLSGFFQMYWSIGYGALMAKRGDPFQLIATPEGFTEKSGSGATKVSVYMDKAYLVTGFDLESLQMNATVKPGFKPGEDGLLRLRRIQETVDMGATKIVVDVTFDYQRIGAFDIPNHINMALPGSYNFDYTLSSCQATAGPTSPTK